MRKILFWVYVAAAIIDGTMALNPNFPDKQLYFLMCGTLCTIGAFYNYRPAK